MDSPKDIVLIVLERHGERYVLMYPQSKAHVAAGFVFEWASNPELRFDWVDAEELTARIRGWKIGSPVSMGDTDDQPK